MNFKKILISITLGSLLWTMGTAGDLNFKLKDIENQKVQLSEILDKGPVVISFWATWCHPCQEELKHIQKFHELYSDSGISFYGISIDGVKDKNKIKTLVKGKNYTFPVLLDPEQEVMKSFGLNDVPGVFILSQAGKILYRHNGYKAGDEAELESNILKIIRPVASEENKVDRDTILINAKGDSL